VPCGFLTVEERTENPRVGGSSPPWATTLEPHSRKEKALPRGGAFAVRWDESWPRWDDAKFDNAKQRPLHETASRIRGPDREASARSSGGPFSRQDMPARRSAMAFPNHGPYPDLSPRAGVLHRLRQLRRHHPRGRLRPELMRGPRLVSGQVCRRSDWPHVLGAYRGGESWHDGLHGIQAPAGWRRLARPCDPTTRPRAHARGLLRFGAGW
jgi:hypothetical protein